MEDQGAKDSRTHSGRAQTYYELLGVSQKDFDVGALKTAYKKLALKWHPDKNPDDPKKAEEVFKAISEAYQVLSDETRRKEYDRKLMLQEQQDKRKETQGRGDPYRQSGQTSSGANSGGVKFTFSTGFNFEDPWSLFERHFGSDSLGSLFSRRTNGSRFGRGDFSSMGFGLADDLFERHFGNRSSPFSQQSVFDQMRQPAHSSEQAKTEKYIERTYHMADGTTRKEYIKLNTGAPENSQEASGSRTGQSPFGTNLSQSGPERIRIKYVYR